MSFVFGKSIEFKFIPLAGNTPVRVDSIVSARLYSSAPSETQKLDAALGSTGHIGARVTDWIDRGDYEKEIVFPALTDATPFSGAEYETYYVSINFKYESTGPESYTTEQIIVYRPNAVTSRIAVDPTEVTEIDETLGKHRTDGQIKTAINAARDAVIARYYAMGLEQRKMFDLTRLNRTVAYLAAARLCIGLYTDRAPHWLEKYKEYKGEFEALFESTPVAYDRSGTGSVSPELEEKTGTIYTIR